jgi:hypothetical protein
MNWASLRPSDFPHFLAGCSPDWLNKKPAILKMSAFDHLENSDV